MFFDPRLHKFKGGWAGAGSKRYAQEVMVTSHAWTVAAYQPASSTTADNSWTAARGSESVSHGWVGTVDSSSAPQSRLKHWHSSSSQAVFSPQTASSSLRPVPSQPSSSSTKPANAVRDTAAIADAQTRTITSSDPRTDASGSNDPQAASTTASDLGASSGSSSTSRWHNTWITATSIESVGSLTFEPFLTFGESTKTTASSVSTATSSVTSSESDSTGAFPSATGSAPNLAPTANLYGASLNGRVRTVAGITTGCVVVLLIVLLAALAYVRGGALRGLSSNVHVPHLRFRRRAQPTGENQKNSFRKGDNASLPPRDLENATISSGSYYSRYSQYEDEEGQWEEIDVRDPRSGHMQKDNGEWLESWRRGRERMMASFRRPPELQFNPALPLPPIILDEGRSGASPRSSVNRRIR